MATRKVYVDTDNGSASPTDPTAYGDAYNSLAVAVAGEAANLVTSTTALVIECYGNTADTAAGSGYNCNFTF